MESNKLTILDTTLRDGAQGIGVTFSLQDKLKIAKMLDDLGIDFIEGGWPGSNPKDMAFFNEVKKIKFNHAKISAFSSTKRAKIKIEEDQNIQNLIKAETPAVTVFGKTWDLHVKKALKISLKENLELIYDTIQYLKRYANIVIYDAEHFFDGYKANPKYAIETLKAASEAGADIITLADTNGGSLWFEIEEIINKTKISITKALGIHAHNDSELAVANTLAAVKAGILHVQGTINGLGERCGNANLCSIIPNLQLKMGYSIISEEQLKKLTYISRTISELSNRPPNPNLPFVGDNAFAHKGGVHVSAVLKDPKTYEHIDPQLVGNTRNISVSELSGKSNIKEKLKELGLENYIDNSLLNKLLKKIKELESRGYHFEGADASLELLIKSFLNKTKQYFSLKGFRVFIWKNSEEQSLVSEATIKAEVPKEIAQTMGYDLCYEHTTADGDGPVEVLDKALRKVLEKFYPSLKEVKLTDYKVRILNEQAATKATTRVLIFSNDGKRNWGTVGVSDNIIEASWIALTDAFKFKLMKDDEERGR